MKIRAVLIWSDSHILPGVENGPEWFRDPARNILILRMWLPSCAHQPNLPDPRIIWGIRDLYEFAARQNPPLEPEEILMVTDQTLFFSESYREYFDRMPKFRAKHLGIITVDQIIRNIYLVEHKKGKSEP